MYGVIDMKKIKEIKNQGMKILKKLDQCWKKVIESKIGSKIFMFLPHNFFLFCLFLASLALIVKFNYNRFIPVYNNQLFPDSVYDPILDSSLTISLEDVDQEKVKKNPTDICLMFSTYTRRTNSVYKYIVHRNNEVLYEKEFNSKTVEDGKYSCFTLPDATIENINSYSIEIAPVKTDGENIITVFKKEKSNDAAFKLAVGQPFFSEKLILIAGFMCIFFAINYCINKKKFTLEKLWLILSLFYILPIGIINPPYEVPDEPIHFNSAYRLTQFDKNKSFYENLESPYMTMPSNTSCLGYANIQSIDKVIDLNEVKDCFKNSENIEKKNRYPILATKIAFLPSAFGIKLADMVTNRPAIIFYVGRIFNLLFSIFVIYKAIKMAPKHKEILLLGATLPMFVQQMASYSYDSILNTMCILGVATILKLIYDDKWSFKWGTILLLISGLFICDIKILYLPIFLLLLLIPDKRWNRKTDKYAYCLGIILGSYLLSSICGSLFHAGELKNLCASFATFIAMGCALKLVLEKEKNWKVFLPIVILGSLVALFTKPLFFLVPYLFFLFLPNYKIKKKWAWITLGIVVLGILMIFLVGREPLIQRILEIFLSTQKVEKVLPYVVNPLNALMLFLRTLKVNGWFYLSSIVGYFGWFNFRLNNIYILSYTIIALYIILNSQLIKSNWFVKTASLSGIIIGMLGVFLAMFLYWSSSSLYFIDGVQGRYFIPFLIPFAILLMTSKKKKENKNVSKNVATYINIVLLEYISLLLLFYY